MRSGIVKTPLALGQLQASYQVSYSVWEAGLARPQPAPLFFDPYIL